MEKKELTPNQRRGIDLLVKSLKKKYNFITGWNVEDDDMKYDNTLFIGLTIDSEKTSDYYGFRIRPTIKRFLDEKDDYWYGRSISNPTVYLDLPDNNDDGYQSKVRMNELVNTLYQQLPEKLQRRYISQTSVGEYEHLVNINIFEFIIY
jgi:hypothetical protein